MAIYSLNHSAVGKTTHAPGTAAAHIRYITRKQAEPDIVAGLIPEDRNLARAWMTAHETTSRKNARVCDKLILALPIELTREQRISLLRDFAVQITQGRCPFFGAIHAAGKDATNPHAHLVLIDRDHETGKRLMMTTEKGSTERFRERWEAVCNAHLALAGEEARIDRRSLAAQGIDRKPQIHVGPGAQHVDTHVGRPKSQAQEVRNAPGAKSRSRLVDHEKIDAGRTREEFNEQIVDFNLETAKRSPDFATRHRAALQQKLRAMRKADELRFAEQRRELTRQAREARATTYGAHRAAVQAITEARDARLATVKTAIRDAFSVEWQEHLRQKAADREALARGEQVARLVNRRSHSAIKAMRRGADFVAGHLSPVFKSAAQHGQQRRLLRLKEYRHERELRAREREQLQAAVAPIKAEAREAYRQERSRYTAERQRQAEEQGVAWDAFNRQLVEASTARSDFATRQESEIARYSATIHSKKSAWERAASPEQSHTRPSLTSTTRSSNRNAPSLSRG